MPRSAKLAPFLHLSPAARTFALARALSIVQVDMAEEIEVNCRLLANVGLDTSGQELSAYTKALKRLLELVKPDQFGMSVLAGVVLVAVGHSGQHHWTNDINRLLAKG